MPRKTISSPSDKRVGQRRLDLEKVLRKAAQIPDVIQEPVFREFVGLETVESGCAAALPPNLAACSSCTVCPPGAQWTILVAIAPPSFCCTCLQASLEIICAVLPAGARACVRRSGCNAARSKPAARHGSRRMCRGTSARRC